MSNGNGQSSEITQKAVRLCELQSRIKRLKDERKELKREMRDYADEQGISEENPHVEVETPKGTILVYYVSDSYYVSKMDAEEAELMELELGTEIMANLFDKKIKFETIDEFEDEIEDLDGSDRSDLFDYVTHRSNSSRVKVKSDLSG